MEKFPEMKDFITDLYFENSIRYFAVKEFVEILNRIAIEPGLDEMELKGLISECLDKCNYLESDEHWDSLQDKTIHQIYCLAKDLKVKS